MILGREKTLAVSFLGPYGQDHEKTFALRFPSDLALLQLLSQQRPGGKGARGTGPPTKVKCLPVDPALYDHIFIPWPALALGKY